MSPDCLLDGLFNNGFPDEGTSCYLDACDKYHRLLCYHSDSPVSQVLHWGIVVTATIVAAIIAGITTATTATVALTQTATPGRYFQCYILLVN